MTAQPTEPSPMTPNSGIIISPSESYESKKISAFSVKASQTKI